LDAREEMTHTALALINAFVLALFSGSLLTEAFVLVPFWRTLRPDDFFAFHHDFGNRLFRYFAPLTIAATALPVSLALWDEGSNLSADISAVASLVTVSFFPLYFRKANEVFHERQVSNEDLPNQLKVWAHVHAIRTVIALVAFCSALFAIL
jgi:Domain of unknown function (DUF1772)